jgi:uncharacterized membrane protein YfcA
MVEQVGKKMGWEIAREVEAQKPTMAERARITGDQVKSFVKYIVVFGILFIIASWLAGNPFEFTQRIPSEYVQSRGWAGTDNWAIVWWVVFLCAFLEWMDSAGGMGYGTILTPLMFFLGFDPKQVVPCVMITEMVTGLVAGMVHGEFENVEWKLRPMNETTKLVIVVAITGMVATAVSVSAVYAIFQLHKFWIKLYVTILLVVMGVCSIFTAVKDFTYRPALMWIFDFVGGFNKGVGGGGYGPVITIGGLLSGVPVKSMVAVTSFAEGMTCLSAVIMWFALLSTGIVIDYVMLPSFVIGTVVAAVAAPWTTRVIPEVFWRWLIPIKSLILAAYGFYKIWPDIQKRLLS